MEKGYYGGIVMTKYIKKELFLYSATDYFSLKEHFEEMARKGWMLENIKFLTAIYRKIEPKELVFSVELYPRTAEEDDKKSFINLCEESGWKYIASSKNMLVFYTNKEDNLIPIHTDEKLHEKILSKAIFMDIISRIIWPLSIVRWSRILPISYVNLSTNTGIMAPIFLILLLIITLSYIFGCLIWIIKAKLSVKKNKKIPKTSYAFARLRAISVFILIVTVTLTIMADLIGLKILSLIILSSILILIIFHKVDIRFKEETLYLIKKTALFSIAALVIIYMMLETGSIQRNDKIKAGYIGFTCRDFNITEPQIGIFTRKGSFLVPKVSIYSEIDKSIPEVFIEQFFKYNIGYTIKTTYARAINNRLAEYIFDGMVKDELKFKSEIIDIGFKFDNIDRACLLKYPDDKRIGKIIILRGKEVIYLNGSIDFSDKKNLEIINNKLNDY